MAVGLKSSPKLLLVVARHVLSSNPLRFAVWLYLFLVFFHLFIYLFISFFFFDKTIRSDPLTGIARLGTTVSSIVSPLTPLSPPYLPISPFFYLASLFPRASCNILLLMYIYTHTRERCMPPFKNHPTAFAQHVPTKDLVTPSPPSLPSLPTSLPSLPSLPTFSSYLPFLPSLPSHPLHLHTSLRLTPPHLASPRLAHRN